MPVQRILFINVAFFSLGFFPPDLQNGVCVQRRYSVVVMVGGTQGIKA